MSILELSKVKVCNPRVSSLIDPIKQYFNSTIRSSSGCSFAVGNFEIQLQFRIFTENVKELMSLANFKQSYFHLPTLKLQCKNVI